MATSPEYINELIIFLRICYINKHFRLSQLKDRVFFIPFFLSTFNCYCWTSITMEFTYLSRVLRPLNIKGQPTVHDRFHVVLIVQLGEHCIGSAKVVGSNPVQSLKIFQVFFSSSIMAAFASIVMSTFNCYSWTSITT